MNSTPEATWRKSSYSAGDGGDCLEVATGIPTVVPVRDSKNPVGPTLRFQAEAWSVFVDEIRRGVSGRGGW
ncbi:DUF397 domain-containing protein [Streptomyces sp. CS113]|uniref:DUF397 domain-containing protein n=1 Tax=Streptomyces TaxID=1883 RepID=UPI000B412EC5|nr:DUF397 domain-containing protein [Streptomyces sp. CS113]OWA05246.1 DUF397 domain-containing protein [Streptomyces sp. CS113]